MLNKLLQFLREVWQKMIGTSNIESALGIEISLNSAMLDALQIWSDMYVNKASWVSDPVKSLGLPAAIAGEVARSATIEMAVKFDGSVRADFLKEQFKPILNSFRIQLEYACAKGGIVFKPYVDKDAISIDCIQADQFYPVNFDSRGNMTSAVFMSTLKKGSYFYTRLEYHELVNTTYKVKNMAFRSATEDTLGNSIPLNSVEEWAELSEEVVLVNIDKPLFAYFRYPMANSIDTNSHLGVSCYSRAVDLIQQADEAWENFMWELESAKRALYVDSLAFDKDASGKPILPKTRLYRPLNLSGGVDESFYEEWSPGIREQSYLKSINEIMKKIEYTCGLAFGVLSDPEYVTKTATEIKASKQRSAATITDVQKEIQKTIDHLVFVMDTLTTLYSLAPKGEYTLDYDFDDSLIIDSDKRFSHDMQVVGINAMSKLEFLVRNYKLDEEVAKEWIEESAKESAANESSFFSDE